MRGPAGQSKACKAKARLRSHTAALIGRQKRAGGGVARQGAAWPGWDRLGLHTAHSIEWAGASQGQPRMGVDWHGLASPGKDRPGWAGQGTASHTARLKKRAEERRGLTGHGVAMRGLAWPGPARPGKPTAHPSGAQKFGARPGLEGRGPAMLGMVGHCGAGRCSANPLPFRREGRSLRHAKPGRGPARRGVAWQVPARRGAARNGTPRPGEAPTLPQQCGRRFQLLTTYD